MVDSNSKPELERYLHTLASALLHTYTKVQGPINSLHWLEKQKGDSTVLIDFGINACHLLGRRSKHVIVYSDLWQLIEATVQNDWIRKVVLALYELSGILARALREHVFTVLHMLLTNSHHQYLLYGGKPIDISYHVPKEKTKLLARYSQYQKVRKAAMDSGTIVVYICDFCPPGTEALRCIIHVMAKTATNGQ